MVWESTPQGVTYSKQQVEYQQFPEEFFSGADVILYFGDTWVDDVVNISFSLAERVQPVYGYASYTWDTIIRGSRIIQGSFTIVFREAGYLYKVLDELGKKGGQAVPDLARMLAGEKQTSDWKADAMRTIEESLGTSPNYPPLKDFVLIKTREYQLVPGGRAIMWARDLGQRLGLSVGWDAARKVAILGGQEFKPYKVENGKAYVYVREVAEKFGYYVHWDSKTRYILIVPRGAIVITSDRFKVTPGESRAVMLPEVIAPMIGVDVSHIEVKSDGVYIGGRKYSRVNNVFPGKAGVYVREVAEDKNCTVSWVKEIGCIVLRLMVASPIQSSGKVDTAYTRSMNEYEKQIWGEDLVRINQGDNHFSPFFYSGKNMGTLLDRGFDIYIVYGPLPYEVKERLNRLPDLITYNTTVKAIRNVQITGCEQVIGPTGEPILEAYQFVARDMD